MWSDHLNSRQNSRLCLMGTGRAVKIGLWSSGRRCDVVQIYSVPERWEHQGKRRMKWCLDPTVQACGGSAVIWVCSLGGFSISGCFLPLMTPEVQGEWVFIFTHGLAPTWTPLRLFGMCWRRQRPDSSIITTISWRQVNATTPQRMLLKSELKARQRNIRLRLVFLDGQSISKCSYLNKNVKSDA